MRRSPVIASPRRRVTPPPGVLFAAAFWAPLVVLVGLGGGGVLGQELSSTRSGRIAGRVLDAETRAPVIGAEVALPGLGRRTLVGDDGRFSFPFVTAGAIRVTARRLGYADAEGVVEVLEGKVVELDVTMAVHPIPLPPITVIATREERSAKLPGLRGLDTRLRSGWGQFILEDQIQLRSPTRVTDLLQGATGVEVVANGRAIFIRRTQCPPTVYLDDVKITRCPVGGGPSRRGACNPFSESAEAVNLLSPAEIVAIEVYRGPAETPGQYLDSNSRCGVILIWTRRGGT